MHAALRSRMQSMASVPSKPSASRMSAMVRVFPCAAILIAMGCCSHEHVALPPPLKAEEIIRLSKEGTSPEEIMRRIHESRTVYLMDAKDVVRLHENGVDDAVIDCMLETQRRDIERRAHSCCHGCDPCWGPCGHCYPGPLLGFWGTYCW